MRTTLSLDPDVEALVRKAMGERRLGLKRVVNEALRAGLRASDGAPTSTPTFHMGTPSQPLSKALQLATSA